MEANEQVQTATKQEDKGSKRKFHPSDSSTPSSPPRPTSKKTSKRQREGKEEERVGHELVSVWETLPNELLHTILPWTLRLQELRPGAALLGSPAHHLRFESGLALRRSAALFLCCAGRWKKTATIWM
ncbi:hypothetical protein QOT17_020307 [Balamuthia mandrillaris]